ncbi:MAG: thiamine phosphate synthase [Pedobacter sp.]|nr:MAG: thiamine phosphate synthase [Pedobacter sp.]
MKLIVISNPVDLPKEAVTINALFDAGLTHFHLRKPEAGTAALRSLLDEIDPLYNNRIALHQHHEIANQYNISRLHYTEAVRQLSSIDSRRSLREKGYKLSTSVHSLSMIANLADFNYVFYGPVFESISKMGYAGVVSPDFKLKKTRQQPEVIALGGVQVNRINNLNHMGFDGVAVLGALWNIPEEAVTTFNHIKTSIAALKQKTE